MPESVWIMCCGKLGRCIAQYYNRENVPEVIDRDEPAHTPREQRYADAEQAAKAWAQQSGRTLAIVRTPPNSHLTPEMLASRV